MNGLAPLLEAIDTAPRGPQIGAFFDFDGTLISGYSAGVVYRDRLRRMDIGFGELGRSLVAVLDMQLRGADVDALMSAAITGLGGRTEDDMVELGERLFRQRIAGMVYPGARELVDAHQRAGHTVAIATSATAFQAGPLARDLEVDELLCTEVEVEDGLLTGHVDGSVLWGEGKAGAVRDLAERRDLDLGESFAYGNGDEDLPYLEAVGRPVALNPESDLRRHADSAGWMVAELEPPGGGFGLGPLVRTTGALSALGLAAGLGVGAGLLNRNRRTAANVASGVGPDLALALGGVSLNVQGEEHLWEARPAVFVFNHQSSLDMLVVGSLLRRDFTGVAKKEASRDPRFAPVGALIDVVYVDRADGRSAREALAPVVDRLRAGTSLAIAPEGTRSVTRRLGPFKKGAFHMAMQAGVPVVPVVIRNAGDVMWRNSFFLRPGTVDVRVLEPVDTGDWRRETIDDHVADVRGRFERALAGWRR